MLVLFLEWSGTFTGIAGALLVASNTRYSPWGWLSFLISSTCMAGFAGLTGAYGLLLLECCFFLTNVLGLWRWLLLPYIEKRTTTP
ncbi:nicotinamide mononucleotide transporter (plasmid) [Pseudomonas silesiensis]|uniref:nicotinamide mononucleotide transporter n=1 Tax=Pseudomonas silesiensis TaxID=1853130 RepID=UPI0030D05D42